MPQASLRLLTGDEAKMARKQFRIRVPESPIAEIEVKDVIVGVPQIISLGTAKSLMAEVEDLEQGSFALPVAFMLFAGIRPDLEDGEISRIEGEIHAGLKNVAEFKVSQSKIYLGPAITKTKRPRWITMPPNLKHWLDAYPLTPDNFKVAAFGDYRPVLRKKYDIPHDGLRHTFCSFYTTAFGPAAAALAAGHSESMQRARYLNGDITEDEAKEFFSILPRRGLRNSA